MSCYGTDNYIPVPGLILPFLALHYWVSCSGHRLNQAEMANFSFNTAMFLLTRGCRSLLQLRPLRTAALTLTPTRHILTLSPDQCPHGNRHNFPVLESSFESWASSGQAQRNLEANQALSLQVATTRTAIGASDRKVHSEKRESRKLTVEERIDLLRDEGSDIFYIGQFAGLNMPYGNIYNASNAVSVVKIAGEMCVVSANMWTFKGGTIYPITVKKQLRAQEVAMENRLPCIYLVDSGGAFLPLQVDHHCPEIHQYQLSFSLTLCLSSIWLSLWLAVFYLSVFLSVCF